MKAVLSTSSYFAFVRLIFGSFCLMPMEAVALTTTQYARVVAQAEQIAFVAAQKSSLAAKVAAAAVATNPLSTAVRFVAGPLGWAALGVSAGLAIAQLHFSQDELHTIKSAAAPVTPMQTGSGDQFPSGSILDGCQVGSCQVGDIQQIWVPNGLDVSVCLVSPVPRTTPPTGWSGGSAVWAQPAGSSTTSCYWHFYITYDGSNGQRLASQGGIGEATQQDVQNFVMGLPASDPSSLESNLEKAGVGTSPNPASTVETVPVSPTDVPTTVKPKPVPAGDAVVSDNVPPPPGTQTQTTQQQQTTTTTTTTQNPDGSTTTQDDTTTTASCAAGTHQTRTFGSVLQEHQALWNSSGPLSALNLLKALTWPTTLPVISLPSSFFGTQSVDFNQWAWFFTALRTLVIAVASLAAYRIIFVGGR